MAQWTYGQQRKYRWQVAALNQATGGHFGDDERRDLMDRVVHKRSTADCDGLEMKRVIDEQTKLLRQCGITQRKAPGRRTFSQVGYIEHLVGQLGWSDPARLQGFITRQFSGWTHSVEDLTVVERSKLITALSGLLKSQRAGTARSDRPADDRPRRTWTPSVVPGGVPLARAGK